MPTDSPILATPRCEPHTNDPQQLPRWQHGHVAWFNTEKGFGFLTPDTGPAVFVAYQVIDVPGLKTLTAGQPVTFTATDTTRGPEATRVVPYTRTTSVLPLPAPGADRPLPRTRPDRPHRSRCRARAA
ncbi:cold-shock protein [Nocardia altamirensis]|uniref:cold-shock protein n=1 Tax=Nocardia altamirensis TaxID=472158 RepID=UPI00083FE7A8|nr:cold shock domain-containing protein [Nocardia altamirensis]